MLPGIEAFLDADCLEIGFPERLEKLFVSVHQTFVEHAGDKMSFATVLTKSHLAHLLQVVIVPIGSPDIINQPTLVGKTVLEMPRHQRKGILFGLDGSKESTVRSLLEADKLKQAYTLPIHPLPHTGELQHIRVGKVRFNGARSIYRLADIAEQQHGSFRFLCQPALGEAGKCRRRQLLLQSAPDATGLLLIGYHCKYFIVEQWKRLSFQQQCIGESAAGVGFKNRSQQSLKSLIV